MTSIALLGVFIVCAVLIAVPVVGVVLAAVGVLGGFVVGLANSARRLHDRGKSALWLAPMYGPAILLSGLSGMLEASDPTSGAGLGALTVPFSIWILIELGCLKGTAGPNRFGPDPLDPTPGEVLS